MINLSQNKEIQQFSSLELLAAQVVEGFITGLHKSPFHGFSVEFAEHRLYNTGESVKNIDWKLFARTDKLFVKRFEEETNLRCQLVIDSSSSMFFPEGENTKFLFAAQSAAALVYLLKKQRDAFGLTVFSNDVSIATPAKSTTVHQKLIFTELERLIANPPKRSTTSLAASLHQVAEQVHKRSLVIVFSDMMDALGNPDDLFSALQHLKHNKHEVVLFQVSDRAKELQFNFDNRPYIFEDIETGEELKLYPNQVKEHYLQAVNQFKSQLLLKSQQYKIDLVEAAIQDGFSNILATYLMKRSKLA